MITKQAIQRVIRSSREYIDLYILAAAALAFTVLGFLNDLSPSTLSSAILALLTVLAISQIRSRNHVSDIAKSQTMDPFSRFAADFPEGFFSSRAVASSFLFIGESMVRTVQTMRTDMLRILGSGGTVRVLVLDPTDDGLLRVADSLRVDLLRGRIKGTLDELESMRSRGIGNLEIRVSSFVPKVCIHAYDLGARDAVIFVQHYEYKPPHEAAPIFRFDAKDGFWHDHFTAEAMRMWEDGTHWPLAPSKSLTRAPRPAFNDAFGEELTESLAQARDLLITGVTRNTFVRERYNKLEEWLSNGGAIRFILIDPTADAIVMASDRYYAARSAENTRERVRDTLQILRELKNSTGGSISVRLSPHPIAMGLIAIDSVPGAYSDASALFIEYFTYQAVGEPKFVLQPTDGPWFDQFVAEAERLWAGASDYALADRTNEVSSA